MRSSALFLAAHKHKLARPARCRVVCCVFGFLGSPRALFCSISQHTGQVLRLPLGHPAGTVLRFLVFRPGLGSVSPNIAAHRRGSCFMLVDAHLSAPHPHPSPVAGVSFSLRPPPSPLCVLRFLVFRLAPSPVLFDIAAHRPRRDAAWMEAQVLGADAGARVRGVWRRPGCRAWVCGGVWKRGEVAHRVWERGCGNAAWGEG